MIWLLMAIGLYVLLLLAISWISIHPFRIPIFLSPGAMGAPQEDIVFESTDGVRLSGWWVESRDSNSVAILAHGYMMNRSELTPVAVSLWKKGFSCLILDFRGHGKSQTVKCGLGYHERFDIKAAVNFARAKRPDAKIVVIGSSMGSAASALAASEDPHLVDALVLDSCYSRLPEAVTGWWRFVGGNLLCLILRPTVWLAMPMVGFNPYRIDVAKALERVHKPILILHGDRDTLALPGDADRNHAACKGETRLVWFQGCGHSEGRWIIPDLYEASLTEFLDHNGFFGKIEAKAK